MKLALASLFCALIFSSLVTGQEQPDTARPPAGARGRGGGVSRPEPMAAGRSITLDILIADVVGSLDNPTSTVMLQMEKSGKLACGVRLRMATLDEIPGFIQVGGQPGSRSALVTRGSFGGTTTSGGSAVPQNGLQFQATSRIEDDGSIVVQVYLERPEGAVPQKLLAADASDGARRNFAFLSQNTVRLQPGEATLVSGRQSMTGNDESQTWIVITATVGREIPKSKAAP
jgi:hypothetical protein